MTRTKKLVFLALITSMALVIHYLEGYFPSLMPGIPGARLGLANIFTVVILCLFGWREALVVIVLRSVLGPILGGAPTSIFYSLAGGLISGAVMFILVRCWIKQLSLYSISIAGAIFHNVGQLLVASVVLNNFYLFTYLPVMTGIAIPTGLFVGFSSIFILKFIRQAKVVPDKK